LLEAELRGLLDPEPRDEPPELLLALLRDDAADLLEPPRALVSPSAALRLVCLREFLVVATWSPFQE
jgi:hypothetical protein